MHMQHLINELKEAQNALETAEKRTAIARNEQCNALNRVNNAQKAIDAAILELRKGSPRQSEWKRRGEPRLFI
jgi:hypothetical protein